MAHHRVGSGIAQYGHRVFLVKVPGTWLQWLEGCSVCFLTLDTPVDLSAYDSVTLSFYRWMDPGMNNSEFLGVDIGNNGSYRRLKTWSSQDADGEWHLETITLSGDQISNGFTLRFFGIAQNNFTTFAIDNVMIAATPDRLSLPLLYQNRHQTLMRRSTDQILWLNTDSRCPGRYKQVQLLPFTHVPLTSAPLLHRLPLSVSTDMSRKQLHHESVVLKKREQHDQQPLHQAGQR